MSTDKRDPEAMFMEHAWKLFARLDLKAMNRCMGWLLKRYRDLLEEERSKIVTELKGVDYEIAREDARQKATEGAGK